MHVMIQTLLNSTKATVVTLYRLLLDSWKESCLLYFVLETFSCGFSTVNDWPRPIVAEDMQSWTGFVKYNKDFILGPLQNI